MNDVAIREGAEADLSAILALYLAAGIGDISFTEEEARDQWAVFRRYPSFRIYVALLGQEIVGTYELLVMDNFAKRGSKSGIVEDVAVDPLHQGRGIGRAMMMHAKEQCRVAGCYKMLLSSNVRREEAHRFYESLGFTKHGYSFLIEL